jgi:hypothetical protein
MGGQKSICYGDANGHGKKEAPNKVVFRELQHMANIYRYGGIET